MAGGSGAEEPKFTGLSKYFNSETIKGRANTTKVTYAAVAMIGLYYFIKSKKKEPAQK